MIGGFLGLNLDATEHRIVLPQQLVEALMATMGPGRGVGIVYL